MEGQEEAAAGQAAENGEDAENAETGGPEDARFETPARAPLSLTLDDPPGG